MKIQGHKLLNQVEHNFKITTYVILFSCKSLEPIEATLSPVKKVLSSFKHFLCPVSNIIISTTNLHINRIPFCKFTVEPLVRSVIQCVCQILLWMCDEQQLWLFCLLRLQPHYSCASMAGYRPLDDVPEGFVPRS